VTANPSSGGVTFVTEDTGAGVQLPVSKVSFGPHGTNTPVDDATGKRLPVKVGGGIAIDASANAPAVNTLGTLLVTMAVNAARLGAFVQNQSINEIYVVLDDGVSGTPTIITLDPASAAGKQGGSWDTRGFLHTGRIRVYGTAGAQIGAGQT
jgi:hypothetical protein